jgi:hypothetical protein
MGDWLIGEFSVFGILLQNWMVTAFVITIIALIYAWRRADCIDG